MSTNTPWVYYVRHFFFITKVQFWCTILLIFNHWTKMWDGCQKLFPLGKLLRVLNASIIIFVYYTLDVFEPQAVFHNIILFQHFYYYFIYLTALFNACRQRKTTLYQWAFLNYFHFLNSESRFCLLRTVCVFLVIMWFV